jgi:hypothetical protein
MSKDKKQLRNAGSEVVLTPDEPVPELTSELMNNDMAPMPRLLDVDRLALELAKQRRQTALAEAKTALAQNENAELSYKYVVLQLYMKYGLTDADAISESGEIVKGGALPQNQPKQQ